MNQPRMHNALELKSLSAEVVTSISFGSCNRQYLDQPLWNQIAKLKSQLWLWTGDAVYARVPGTIKEVHDAYDTQLKSPQYRKFLETGIQVEGVYDDHDWGVNDAGSELDAHRERMDAFLNFIGASRDDQRYSQNALYISRTYGPPGKEIKVIILDTRTQRDKFLHLNIGLQSPLLQAVWRMITGKLCIGSTFKGDMLGENQWNWLENELQNSTAAFHIILSTIQVFTSNPIAESWGHFPASREKLVQLLEANRPRGTMFLSGDVHLAELITGVFAYNSSESSIMKSGSTQLKGVSRPETLWPPILNETKSSHKDIIEVTSSGLTHSCAGRYSHYICAAMLKHWQSHRSHTDDYYTHENFGSINFNWDDDCSESCDGICNAIAVFNVHDANGQVVLSTTRSSCQRWHIGQEKLSKMESVLSHGKCTQGRIYGVLFLIVFLFLFYVIFVKRTFARHCSKKND